MGTQTPDGGNEGPSGFEIPDPGSGVLIVGGGQTGRRVAEHLAADRSVHHVDDVATAVARSRGYEASHAPDLSSTAALAATGVTAGDLAVVMTGRDGLTLLVTQLLRTTFGVERIRAVLTDPRTKDAFDIPSVTVVCGASAVADAVLDTTDDSVTLGALQTGDEDLIPENGHTGESV